MEAVALVGPPRSSSVTISNSEAIEVRGSLGLYPEGEVVLTQGTMSRVAEYDVGAGACGADFEDGAFCEQLDAKDAPSSPRDDGIHRTPESACGLSSKDRRLCTRRKRLSLNSVTLVTFDAIKGSACVRFLPNMSKRTAAFTPRQPGCVHVMLLTRYVEPRCHRGTGYSRKPDS